MAKPDLSLIDDDFIEQVPRADRPNLQIEMLKRLLSDEISIVRAQHRRRQAFSEMLERSVLRYQNRTLDAAQVVAELVELAQELKPRPTEARAPD